MTEDEVRPGCPFSVRNEGLVRERIQEEHFATVRMMANEFGVKRENSSNLSGRLGQEKGHFPVCATFIV